MYKTAYYIILTAYILLQSVAVMLLAKHFIHMLQQESYYKKQYVKHMTDCKKELLLPVLVGAIFLIEPLVLPIVIDPLKMSLYQLVLSSLLFAVSIGVTVISAGYINSRPVIKPLIYTARIKRLYTALAVLLLALGFLTVALFGANNSVLYFSILTPLVSVLVMAAAVITEPIEFLIKQWYIADAKRILRQNPDLKIVGITGSYGKTSTKFILSTLLKEKYSVLTPPSNYNTTMGVVRAVREHLQPDDEVFICEMGARHRGDIAEICKFIKPDLAIITSIGPQHLETFKTIETIRDTKFELVEAVKQDGAAFYPYNNEYTRQMYDKTGIEKHYTNIENADANLYMYAQDIKVTNEGSTFTLVNENGERIECRTVLLGEHNIQNIIACAACAYKMGLNMEQIRRGIAKIEPIEHRLQIVSQNPITVIDDAYNSSPNGAKAALKVLSKMPQNRIVITPGFVEMGDKLDEYHCELGMQIAQNTDIAILVGGERTQAIQNGILKAGYKMDNIYQASSLNEALEVMKKVAKPGDTVLFENDLPDAYMSR